MAEGFRDWLLAWDEYRLDVDQFRELDNERVLVLIRLSGRGKTSGLEIGQTRARSAQLFHVRDGKVMRLVNYLDRERGLADLGLAPESSPRS